MVTSLRSEARHEVTAGDWDTGEAESRGPGAGVITRSFSTPVTR